MSGGPVIRCYLQAALPSSQARSLVYLLSRNDSNPRVMLPSPWVVLEGIFREHSSRELTRFTLFYPTQSHDVRPVMYDKVLIRVRLTPNGTYLITTTDFTEDGEELSVTEAIPMENEDPWLKQ
jgi:hypothetical protein